MSGSRGGRGGFASASSFANAYSSNPLLGREIESQEPKKKTKLIETAPLQCFRKPITPSGRVPLKGTAGKKLRIQIEALFKIPTEEDWERLWPKKANVVSEKLTGTGLADVEHKPLVYWIQREESPSNKNDIGSPMFIDLSGGHLDSHMVYPTVYALAIVPNLMRPMYCHAGVSSYIVSGADCMWPGVLSEPDAENGVGRFQQGERRCLVAAGNPVPFAVGWISADSATVVEAGRTGKALNIVHCYADELWKLGNKQPPNIGFAKDRVYAIRSGVPTDQSDESEAEIAPVAEAMGEMKMNEPAAASSSSAIAAPATSPDGVPENWDDGFTPVLSIAASSLEATPASSESDAVASIAPQLAASSLEQSTDPSALESEDATAESTEENDAPDDGDEQDEGDDDQTAQGDEEQAEDQDDEESGPVRLSSAEMDAALLKCFLLAVQTRIDDTDLPMDPSTLLTHMEAVNVEHSERLDVKRSSYKKMAKFLTALGKMGLAKSKTGGGKQGMCSCELQIMSVSRTSPMMNDVSITPAFLDAVKKKQKAKEKQHAKREMAAADASAASSFSSGSAATPSSSGSSGKLSILHMYRPESKLQRFFFTEPADQKRLWKMSDAKDVLWKYVQEKNLDAQGRVKLDQPLYETFYHTNSGAVKAPSGVDRNKWNDWLAGKQVTIEVTKAELSNRFDGFMQEYYSLVHGPVPVDWSDLTFARGPLPSIDVSTEMRQGKKVMTKVAGLHVYGLEPAVFAKEAQKMLVPANAKHKAYLEVFIQGNVTTDIGVKLQNAYGIPAHCVKIVKKGK